MASLNVRLSTLALRGLGQSRRDAWERQMGALTERKEVLERQLSHESDQFHEEQALRDPRPVELPQALPLNAALVDILEYWHHRPSSVKRGQRIRERRLAAWVVRHDRSIVRIELGPVKPLADATENWRRAILHDGGGGEAARLSSTLRLGSTELAEVRPEGSSPKSCRDHSRAIKPPTGGDTRTDQACDTRPK